MSLETRLEEEKAALRRAIRDLNADSVDRIELLRRLPTPANARQVMAYVEHVMVLEERLIELETTECQGGLWYKRFLRPGEAREILDRSLAKG
jgi:hypothetical protein